MLSKESWGKEERDKAFLAVDYWYVVLHAFSRNASLLSSKALPKYQGVANYISKPEFKDLLRPFDMFAHMSENEEANMHHKPCLREVLEEYCKTHEFPTLQECKTLEGVQAEVRRKASRSTDGSGSKKRKRH